MRVAYVTDVEGRWEKLEEFVERTPGLSFESDHIELAPDVSFVFGGDAIDRGPAGRRIVDTLLATRARAPERVVLLAGNRDINKLRLLRELDGHPPPRTPPEVASGSRVALLKHIFERTMGAPRAFEYRLSELGPSAREDAVAESFLEDLAPTGALTRYLSACVLAHRVGSTLFLHGAITEESYGVTPRVRERAANVDVWIERLNAFYAEDLEAFRTRRLGADGQPAWDDVVAYQAPLPGTRLNQASVVYGRPQSVDGQPILPPAEVVTWLQKSGVERVVLGHTPTGDCPTLLRDDSGFQVVLADTSYGRIEGGPSVVLTDDELRVSGVTRLDSGEERPVQFTLGSREAGALGLRTRESGRLVKARLDRGDALLFRALADYRVEQVGAVEAALDRASLEPPR
ncbi:MAG: metallophosphoesterase [Polyangiaceae bacterium]